METLATKSVVHGPAASPSPAVLLKHGLPDPTPEPTLRECAHQARPRGDTGTSTHARQVAEFLSKSVLKDKFSNIYSIS